MMQHITELMAELIVDEDEELEQYLDSFLSHTLPLFDFFTHNPALKQLSEERLLSLFDQLTSGSNRSKLFNMMTAHARDMAF